MKAVHVDIHSHVSFDKFDNDREQVLSRMRESGIATITVGVDFESSKKAVELSNKEEGIYAAVGLHPADNTNETFNPQTFNDLVADQKVVAIGECGLDFFRRDGISAEERTRQMREFMAQADFALKHDKPLMIHCRSAHEEMLTGLSQLKKEAGERLRGNIHFFTASTAIAKRYNELGFTVSFPGVITFAHDYDDAVRQVPLSMMMVETDAPYAAPVPHRGTRNEPSLVIETIRKVAELRQEPFSEVAKALRDTTERVFGI